MIANLLSKLYKPNKEIVSCAKKLVNMIDDNKIASVLLAKLDGHEETIKAEEALSTKYRDILADFVASINYEIHDPIYKIKIQKDYSTPHILRLGISTLKGLDFYVNLTIEDGTKPTMEQSEWMHRQLLLTIIKNGILSNGKQYINDRRSNEKVRVC